MPERLNKRIPALQYLRWPAILSPATSFEKVIPLNEAWKPDKKDWVNRYYTTVMWGPPPITPFCFFSGILKSSSFSSLLFLGAGCFFVLAIIGCAGASGFQSLKNFVAGKVKLKYCNWNINNYHKFFLRKKRVLHILSC